MVPVSTQQPESHATNFQRTFEDQWLDSGVPDTWLDTWLGLDVSTFYFVSGKRFKNLQRYDHTLRTLHVTSFHRKSFSFTSPQNSFYFDFFFFLLSAEMSDVCNSINASLTLPDKSHLFHLVLKVSALLLWLACVITVLFYVKCVSEKGNRGEQRWKNNTLKSIPSHLQRLQLCAIWMYNSVRSIHIQHTAARSSISLILSKSN